MSLANETTIILGADGFIGRNAVRFFAERGWPTHAIGKAAGDLSDWGNVERAFRAAPPAGRILHLVTRQRTGQVQYDIQGELLAINARVHLNVLEAWRLYQPQAKLISTGSSCALPERDRLLREDDFQTGPLHPSVRGYGLVKQMLAVGSEVYASQYGLSFLHLLLATVYGPADHKASDRTHFMTAMIDRAVREKAEGKSEFTVWGGPNSVRDLLYVDDQLDAILAADAAFTNQLLNCSANAPVKIGDAAIAVLAALDWPAKITYPPGTFQGASFKSLDASIFLERTGWRPSVTMEDGVRRVLKADY
jgi:GDP-L-fucose synthase